MKKGIILGMLFVFSGATIFAQAVRDRNIIPVAVNLNQVLRMTITNGGNIEFSFNTIDAYKTGLSGDAVTSGSANVAASEGIYQTDFTVSSSTRWAITYGSEMPTFIGTDNPANLLPLDNVGYSIINNGAHVFETGGAKGTTATEELWSTPTDGAIEVAALEAYPVILIEDNDGASAANAGDETDNSFTLVWRCGTAEAGAIVPMNAVALIDQQPSPVPDRYVVNVIFELGIDN
jgi:hypothetical protein